MSGAALIAGRDCLGRFEDSGSVDLGGLVVWRG